MNKSITTIIIAFLINIFNAYSQTPSEVNFTVGTNTSIDDGDTYMNYYAGDTGPESRFVIGFEIELNSIDGSLLNLDPIASFCSEIQEPIGNGTYTFDASPLSGLAAGTAGQAGTASTGIPIGGIGTQKSSRLQYFFDQNYTSTDLTGWTPLDLHAFQLGVWEITHDSDLDLETATGFNYLGGQTGPNNGFRKDAIALAQTWLDDVATFNPSSSYVSNQYKFWSLVDNGNQDVILATLIGSTEEEAISNLIVVPELSSLAYMGILLSLSIICMKKIMR